MRRQAMWRWRYQIQWRNLFMALAMVSSVAGVIGAVVWI